MPGQVENVNVRMIKRGDVISVAMTDNTPPQEEVVRSVSVILHMANGVDVHKDSRESVPVHPAEDLPPLRDGLSVDEILS